MRIGILGSGVVGQQLGLGFIKSGHDVKIGTREAGKLAEWLKGAGSKASVGSAKDAAEFGEIIVLATKWDGVEAVISTAGKENFKNKIVIDVTNPLKFETAGQAPTLALAFPESAGKQVQTWLPDSKVVKCFNIINAYYMANAAQFDHPDMFIAGNDAEAKKAVSGIASVWGWDVHDTGKIDQSYILESFAMLWIVYGFSNNHWTHIFKMINKK